MSEHNTCGKCQKWMCCTCPRENNVKGRSVGPDCGSPPCEEFIVKGFYAANEQATEVQEPALEVAEMVKTSPLFAHFRE